MTNKSLKYYNAQTQQYESPYAEQSDLLVVNQNLTNVSNSFNTHVESTNTQAHTIDNIQGLREAIANGSTSQTTATITYYVNGASGSDNNDGLTSATAFKTIQKSIDNLPKIINHNVNISITAGTYNEVLMVRNIGGSENLTINSDSNQVSINGVIARSCTCSLVVRNFTFLGDIANKVDLKNCTSVFVNSCVDETSTSTFVVTNACLFTNLASNVASNKTFSAIFANNASSLVISSLSGSGNTTGMRSSGLSRIFKSQGITIAATTPETMDTGGQIF